ncbi:hypothetical protein Tco_0827843 [Tanacetum coccineum]
MLTTSESSPSKITSSPSLSPQTHPSTSQPPSTSQSNQTTHITEEAAPMPHESPFQSVHSLGRDEGSLSLNELTDLCTLLSMKVKKLEQTIKTSQVTRRAKVVISDDEEDEEDTSNQGRSLIEELDLDAGISLVPPHAADQGMIDDTHISDQLEEYTAGVKAKDKGKAIMHESEPPKKIKKRVQVQMSVDEIDFETALELQKQLDEREEVAAKVDQAHDIDWSDPAILRYHTLQNRPFFMAEVRKNMCLYLRILEVNSLVKDVIAEQAVKESSRTAGGRRKKSLAIKRERETLSKEIANETEVYKMILRNKNSSLLEHCSQKKKVLIVESLATKNIIVDWETHRF